MGDCCWHGTITSTRKPANKINQSQYPWSQNVVSIGLLKIVKGRWACLPLAFRFYPMKKTIDAGNVKINGKTLPFQTKFGQAIEMLSKIADVFRDTPLLIVTDSWFGNDAPLPTRSTSMANSARYWPTTKLSCLKRLSALSVLCGFIE
ncbi:MAG: hypothetical protein KZQ89_03420 [Candidatus Thiodiazotropha sp. (ex Lucinoma kastoroae)]|nr:hypothetical protein [Candidatus Thiodiazotropha sp. (ex Lucinoma kastoroae)]